MDVNHTNNDIIIKSLNIRVLVLNK